MLKLSIKDIIIFSLIIILFFFGSLIWFQLKYINQVQVNSQNIQQIITYLQAQQKTGQPALLSQEQPVQPEAKK